LGDKLSTDAKSGIEDLASLRRLLGPSDDPRMMGRIGTYEIVGLLGQGGMGVVFKAFDPSLNRYVAIKMLAPMLMPSVVFKQRFLREAQSAAAVVHDNVVGIHAISEWQRIPYLVMTFVRGQSLQSRLHDRGHLSLREALRIGLQISAGLEAAHAQGLIHRDIKPANILLESDVDRVMITDFGIAKAIDDLRFTGTNTLLGTPEYMSPEQARDEELDYRADLFSLGCVLYEASTGRSPFRSSTPYGAIRKVIDINPPSVCSVVPDLPAWFAEIVLRLLSKDKKSRFQSAAEVAALLKQCLAHLEQPKLVPFPKSFFQTERNPRSKTLFRRLVMVTPWIAFASLGTWLLLLQAGQPGLEEKSGNSSKQQIATSAQKQTSEPPQSNVVIENDEQEDPITANAGKFVIKVTKTDAIDQMTLGMKPTTNPAANLLLEQLQNGSVQNSSNSFQRNEQSFGGNGNASGSAGGFSGGFAGGSGSTSGSVTSGRSGGLVRPNLAIALEVDSNDKGIFELENMKAVDDQGNSVQWMGPGAFNFYDSAFEKGRAGEMIAYFQEENDTEYLTISGDLKVTPGRRIEVEFTNGEPATKKSGEHTFVLKDVQANDRGIHVTLALPQLVKKRGNQFGNAEAMMKSILEQQGAFEILIQDSEGVFHYPSASGSAGGSSNAGGSAGGFASGFSGGSAGGSAGNSGGKTFGQEAQSNSTQSYTFGGLSDGRKIGSVIVRATEKTGKPKSYPFKLQKVPVPYGTN
jgi:serine/threonine protein kinase